MGCLDVWLVSRDLVLVPGAWVVSYYAEHDHYRVMDCQRMMMVTPVIMGTSAEPLIEWKEISNIEKSFLSHLRVEI